MLLEQIKIRPLIFDGAMGTMIYQRGVFVNACYDELSLSKPDLILNIHREYVAAGVDVIETNTFGANRLKLAGYGLADQVGAINRAAVQLARQAVKDAAQKIYVAASVGPCLTSQQKLTPALTDAVAAAFSEQLTALAEAGVDLLVLETFYDLDELQMAARIARGTGVPVLASFVLPAGDEFDLATAAVAWTRTLDANQNVDLIGLNCGAGPSEIFEPLRQVIKNTTKPVVAMPNAGGGHEVGGRVLYLNSPEYFTEYAKRYIELGARAVGGCCGTTPAHLRMAVRAIKTMSTVKKHVNITTTPSADTPLQRSATTAEKSKLGQKLAANVPVKLVEILPPRSAGGVEAFVKRCQQCSAAGVDAVNLPDGPRASARISVLIAAALAQRAADIEALPHYCCRDRNLIGMQADLLGAQAVGLHNWLLITGDPPKLGDYPDATGVFDLDAIGLCRLASNLNAGYDAAGHPIAPPATILIGVGANPIAVEMEREIERYFAKIDAGAEFAVTQPVFDPEALLRFIDRVNRHTRRIPIIAGCYPLTSLRNAEFMNQHVPGVSVPQSIIERMARCSTREDGVRVGVEIAREALSKIADAVQGFQVSAPLGRIEPALQVLGL